MHKSYPRRRACERIHSTLLPTNGKEHSGVETLHPSISSSRPRLIKTTLSNHSSSRINRITQKSLSDAAARLAIPRKYTSRSNHSSRTRSQVRHVGKGNHASTNSRRNNTMTLCIMGTAITAISMGMREARDRIRGPSHPLHLTSKIDALTCDEGCIDTVRAKPSTGSCLLGLGSCRYLQIDGRLPALSIIMLHAAFPDSGP